LKTAAVEPVAALAPEPVAARAGAVRAAARNRSVVLGGAILALVVLVAILQRVGGRTVRET
jgi:hypothetical protein